jgi:hypothetical protein
MEHRHLNTLHWSAAAVDSALERGNLQDWRELFSAARSNPELAALVLRVARQRDLGGASILAANLVSRLRPELSELKIPPRET